MKKKDYSKLSIDMHKRFRGKLEINSKVSIDNKDDLSTAYTPGVAEPCRKIAENKDAVYDYTMKSRTIAVITDGSAVLGLGDIGPEASIPVMEGKSALFKRFAGLDSFPIAIDTKDVDEFVTTVKNIAPIFGGINLEDISAPRCFEIENRLKKELDIPVFHDDQHGTAIVVLAGLINSLKLANKSFNEIKIVVSGAGAAGTAITKLLFRYGAKNIILVDTKGAIYEGRSENMTPIKNEMAKITNLSKEKGSLRDVIKDADVFIGVSKPGVLSADDVRNMNERPIIFALSNPVPEIMPDLAINSGAFIVSTGRSDFPNQVNNVLVFPGIFKGALEARVRDITDDMKIVAAEALASMVEPNVNKIIPDPFEEGIAENVARAVKEEAVKSGLNRI